MVSSIASDSHRLETRNSQGQTRTARQVYRMMFSVVPSGTLAECARGCCLKNEARSELYNIFHDQ